MTEQEALRILNGFNVGDEVELKEVILRYAEEKAMQRGDG